MQAVDEEKALDLAAMTAGEDAGIDAANSRRHQDPGALFAGLGQSFGEGVGGHAGGVRGRRVVGPSDARAVPVTVAGDSAVVVGLVDPVVEGVFERLFAGFDKDGRVTFPGWVEGLFTHTRQVDFILIAIYKPALSRRFERGVPRAEDQGAG